MNTLEGYIKHLKTTYDYLVIPADKIPDELSKLNALTLRQDQEPARLYWTYMIQQTKLADWDHHKNLAELIRVAEDQDQQEYVVFGKLARLFFSRSLGYVSALIPTLSYLKGLAFTSIVFDQLVNHIAKLSAFNISDIHDHPAGDTILPQILDYLEGADDIRVHLDPHTMLNLVEFELRLSEDTPVLDAFLDKHIMIWSENDEPVPSHFHDPYQIE